MRAWSMLRHGAIVAVTPDLKRFVLDVAPSSLILGHKLALRKPLSVGNGATNIRHPRLRMTIFRFKFFLPDRTARMSALWRDPDTDGTKPL